jgi:hypothetical protein
MSLDHAARLSRMREDFTSALQRFVARLEQAGERSEVVPEPGAWSPAQVAYHVSLVNELLAGLMDGTITGVEPAPVRFVERNWSEIAATAEPRLTAPEDTRPPAGVKMADALPRLLASGERVVSAIARLTPERGAGFILRTSIVGEISVYQVGEWATVHVIRHNAQVKRMLEVRGRRPEAGGQRPEARGPEA